MDTFKLYVFSLTCITLIFVQLRVDAAPGDDCSVSSPCDTANNENCNGTMCVCNDGFYESGKCASMEDLKATNLRSLSQTENSVDLSWTAIVPPNQYTTTYVINYNEVGGSSPLAKYIDSQVQSTTVTGLSPGTNYSFTVVRSIIKDEQTLTVLESEPLEQATISTTPVKVYGDGCTVGSSDECPTELDCVSSVGKCLCADGSFYTGSTCTSTNVLKPYNLQNVKTYNSVNLSWISPDAAGYTNSYVINYSGQPHNVNGQDVSTVIPNLSPGTTYTFTVVRSITREGRPQTVQASDLYPVTTNGKYSDRCTAVNDTTECGPGLVCVSGTSGNMCRCQEGNFFTESTCTSIDGIRPTITDAQSTSTSSVAVTWNSPNATGYTNSYIIKYTELGTSDARTSTVSGDVSTHPVTGLKAGTSYTFIVTRRITREGRTQAFDSAGSVGTSEKINYGEPCVSSGTCKGTQTDCYSLTCRCKPGKFWTDTECLPNTYLRPGNVSIEKLPNIQLSVTWTASAYSKFVAGYLVELSPPVSSENIAITGTSATISSLTPGEKYSITVSSRSRYLNRRETAAAGVVNEIIKPAAIIDLAPATSRMAPTAQIFFYKAEGRADSYTVTLTGDGYNRFKTASGDEDVLSVSFTDISAGSYYNLLIITISHGVSSDPFSKRIRVRAEAPEAVVGLSVFDPTSRAATVSWKRPINTKGVLYKYTIEVFNSSKCLQRINIQCTECLQAMNISESTDTTCERETDALITRSNLNDVNFPIRYDLTLLPDTPYTVFVTAYNEEGRGQTDQDVVLTEQEASGDPTHFRYVGRTSESVELSWTPPEPRPGVTTYIISMYEWDEDSNQYRSFQSFSALGFYNVSINVTGLSSYWKYRFEMYARTFKGDSNTSNVLEVTTAESAPTAVENLKHQPVDGVYNQYQLSWRCPPQKDGRNGVIRSATVITSRFIQSGHVKQERREYNFENSDCNWSEPITVTAEFNYTFEVYISNSIKGESTTIQLYMPAGPPSFLVSERPIIQVRSGTETEKTVGLLVCTTCLLDNTNGLIVKSGVLVCAKGDCPIRNADEVTTANSFDKSPNWDTTAGVSFSTWYRATEDDWLKGKEASDEIRFVLGEESCGVQDQNRFCNGPLPVDRTYRVWLFACTRVSCTEGDHVEFTLGINNADSLSGSIIAGIVIAAVLVVLAAVILVVYIKVIRPRSQRKRSTQYVSDTSPKDDTYAEIGDGNRMSVIKDGQPEVDYYNTTDSPPRSEDTYDQLKVYSNQGQHDYGKIKVTQT